MRAFDAGNVQSEVRAAFDAYEDALLANNVETLIGFFRDDPATVRMTDESGHYGLDQMAAFRRGRDTTDIARDLLRVDIMALSNDVAVATAEYRRRLSGRRGAQTQVWIRLPEGWRIAAAHVSLGA
ncbi:AtzH-like domain-containing protein [Meridianimarinicoccus sp. RP-17]|uniref:AtzH-like domain-containing protein n=1 Tax=Meridianimarinicoccus zhengii TaxID=2056810 RepID=UPI0013A6C1D8|nr:AtzH-like domain-containing protein [Phycocomes zhengii]